LPANAMQRGNLLQDRVVALPFFTLKALDRFVNGRPFVLGGLMMVYGYLKARLLGDETCGYGPGGALLIGSCSTRGSKQRLLSFLGTERVIDNHVPER